MPRVVSLYLPTWPTDRFLRQHGADAPPPDQPLVMVGREGSERLVLALNDPARLAGLRSGMAAAKAQALISGLVIKDADPEGDAAALERIALWALRRYSPLVAADHPDGIVIDATGAAHLHGDESEMLADMVNRLGAAGVAARAAMADSWGAAHAVARSISRSCCVIPVGETRKAIERLPVAHLRLADETVQGLRRLGFETIGELAATPRAPLALRFGSEPGRKLDHAYGDQAEVINPVRLPDVIEVRRGFAEPIAAPETIARYTAKLATALCEALEAKALGARRLDLLFHRVDNRMEAVRIGTAAPVRDPKRLTRLLCDKIETIDPGFGIELMSLAATLAEPFAPSQRSSVLVEDEEPDVSGLVDTLANRIGGKRIYSMAPVASDVPERSVRRVAPAMKEDKNTLRAGWPRPSRLLPAPEPIETLAMLPDHPPVSFTWRGVRRRVRRADGPERVFGEWWKRDAEVDCVRDYFQVEDDAGERYWIFRAGDGENPDTGSNRWFLHGIFG